ncbi:protein fem-1 homolog C-like [Argopecten irradians]|uniref:protein fem-1 homolog C-like n=1 Tax=Argopecten irradians TaxID=31199 RepID=UPI00371FBD52
MTAVRGSVELCEILVNNGASVNATTIDGYTAMWDAIMLGRLDIVKFFLSVGASPFMNIPKEIHILYVAALAGNKALFNYIMDNTVMELSWSVNGYELLGATAIDTFDNIQEGLKLWEKAMDLRNHYPKLRRDEYADSKQYQRAVDIWKYTISIRRQTVPAMDRVSVADLRRLEEILRKIFTEYSSGATSENVQASDIVDMLELAVAQLHECTERLEIRLLEKNTSEVFLSLLQVTADYMNLLKAGADVNATDKERNTPLHLCIASWQKQIYCPMRAGQWKDLAWLLIENGAHMDAKNSRKKMPLEFLVEQEFGCPLEYTTLKCMAARVILDEGVAYRGYIPSLLEMFVGLLQLNLMTDLKKQHNSVKYENFDDWDF